MIFCMFFICLTTTLIAQEVQKFEFSELPLDIQREIALYIPNSFLTSDLLYSKNNTPADTWVDYIMRKRIEFFYEKLDKTWLKTESFCHCDQEQKNKLYTQLSAFGTSELTSSKILLILKKIAYEWDVQAQHSCKDSKLSFRQYDDDLPFAEKKPTKWELMLPFMMPKIPSTQHTISIPIIDAHFISLHKSKISNKHAFFVIKAALDMDLYNMASMDFALHNSKITTNRISSINPSLILMSPLTGYVCVERNDDSIITNKTDYSDTNAIITALQSKPASQTKYA